MRDAPLERCRAAELFVDQRAQRGEHGDAADPAERAALELIRQEHADQHGGGEHEDDHGEGRAIFVFDPRSCETAETVLITAQGIRADLIHFVLQTVLKSAFVQTY
jgi:hypothetical protein